MVDLAEHGRISHLSACDHKQAMLLAAIELVKQFRLS
jgi:hypothetical protein